MKAKNQHTNQYGITLIEVLATILILGMVVLLLFSVIKNGQEQYGNQMDKNQDLFDISYGLKLFTKDIRKATEVTFDNNTSTLTLKLDENGTKYSNFVYVSEAKILKKVGTTILENVTVFNPTVINSGEVSEITIVIKAENSDPISTKISLRSRVH
ncbi:hypothetical protein D1B33_01210 [Lysinibacillus yapensis]|uniref:Prepilin-type N-terminal cleavage/methylation domain-containing protein n=1 Tax=Ureibacillus yapensis TaxID=2304605 RepID=A0A396SE92_9BACL|nr:prepilin-type N-terminal cleavage/methylation domain-containing protein [Lysinibacillus yapensis]RHW39492.1 hypothetical protein D1B33_01210 [Lysinibacillus yapensis]